MQNANDIRTAFLNYFAADGHTRVASSPLVPRNDPTLMFTNAGMVQFKNVFTGLESRDYVRAVTSQKCVRAGGKHNDLENVGHTARHHTFFEMLGNFSFGDYFKDVAIELAWNLVTREFGLPAEKLLVTVFHEDDQAFDFWKKIAGLDDDRIIRIPTSDNFWAMGETGPCGPCSEIFFDHGDHVRGGPPGSTDEGGDRFIEIWNLVFMEFEQLSRDKRIELPTPSIDTGMGLERIAAVMNGTHDNYDVDLLRVLIEASAGASGTEPDGPHKISHRVIADHLRASGFLIADGVLPANDGRGYVLRRIMRRAMRHVHMMGCKDALLWQLVPILVHKMGEAFPELGRAEKLIAETLKLEETRFRKTLDRGLKLLDEATENMAEGDVVDGETAFRLYDTYGFPLDLTQDALRLKGITADDGGFKSAMERQRTEARKAWVGSGEATTESVWFTILDTNGATDFLGYDTESTEAQVTALVVGGESVTSVGRGQEVAVICNQTPFYGESGGQLGDTGKITIPGGVVIMIRDTQKKVGELHVHMGTLENGTLAVGDDVKLEVDHARRSALRANHSVTHLLHEALRRRLGNHVTQKGSLVAAERMRFDISHPKPVSMDEIALVESDVSAQIRADTPVTTRLMDPEAAVVAGAIALFGESYGDEVRVVSMGTTMKGGDQVPYSTELCGGTHVHRTGEIGTFKIVSESAVAAGVRRIEVVTGAGADEHFRNRERAITEIAELLKTSPNDAAKRVRQLLDERKKLERELADTRRKLAAADAGGAINETSGARDIAGIKFSGRILNEVPARELRSLADDLKKKIGSGVVALISTDGGKVSLVVGVTDDLTRHISAVDLVRAGSQAVGGTGGGGRPDMAQAGGPDVNKANSALTVIEEMLGRSSA